VRKSCAPPARVCKVRQHLVRRAHVSDDHPKLQVQDVVRRMEGGTGCLVGLGDAVKCLN
jgi:hypothetical protein